MNAGDQVRIRQLLTPMRTVLGPGVPQCGDAGIIRHVLVDGSERPWGYIVEGIRQDGGVPWVANFVAEELEPAW